MTMPEYSGPAGAEDLRTVSIRILTTGGTIDKIYFDAKSAYHVGPPQVAEILEAVNVRLLYTVEPVFSKDSLDMTDEDRVEILHRVEAATESRILITHGTDTMVQTGKALDAVRDKTVVLVGSLSPSRFKGSDAEFNVGFALAAVQTLSPGIYIAMNGRIFDVHEVRKNVEQNRFEIDRT